MIGSIEGELEACKQAGTATIQQIQISSLKQFITFHHPPQAVLTILQSIQTILAGNFGQIDMNPATNQPKANDWNTCRKMVSTSSGSSPKACQQIFDKFESDSYLDVRVQTASKQLDAAELTSQKVNICSLACGKLFIWLQYVVKYWQLLKSKKT